MTPNAASQGAMHHLAFPTLIASILALLGGEPAAQTRSGKLFARHTRPIGSATLDLDTGTITRGPTIRDRGATTIVDFDNTDLGGFVGVDSGGGFCEWFDSGVKGTGQGATAGVDNNSDLMNSIVFAYCSAELSVASGGPGGSVKLGFYEGYTFWGGAATTAVAVFTLTGLPANTASSSFFGGFDCYFIRVVFGSLVCFADGPIGYSWKFLDLGTGTINPIGAVLAGTWPFLSCIASCSGTCFTVDGQGMMEGIDQYCPPGYLRFPPFCFGTTSGTFTSISMAIEEVVDKTATVASFNSAAFPNPDLLTATPAIVGQPWTATLTLGLGRTQAGSWICYFGTSQVNPPTGIAIVGSGGLNFGSAKAGRMLLCALDTLGFSCLGAHTGVSGSSSLTACGGGAIPKRIGLVCNDWCAQAVVLGPIAGAGNARLSSGSAGTIGTN